MVENNVEKLLLESENKYNKDYNKLLPIREGNTVIIYHVKYNGRDIKNLIDKINNKYTNYYDDTIYVSYLSDSKSKDEYEKFIQYEKPYTNIKKCKLVASKETNISSYFNNLYFPSEKEGKVDLSIENYPALTGIIEDTFLTPDKYTILDLTDLLKYRNLLYGIHNLFVFDKTIDLPNGYIKKNLDFQDKIKCFFTKEEYNNYLTHMAYKLNDDNLHLNKKEFIPKEKNNKERFKIKSDIIEYKSDLQKALEFEDIAMFPLEALTKETKNNNTKKILIRFADRNKDCNLPIYRTNWYGWFGEKLEFAKNDNNGSKIYNELTANIEANYDFDGLRYESKVIKPLHESVQYKDLYKELYKVKQTS